MSRESPGAHWPASRSAAAAVPGTDTGIHSSGALRERGRSFDRAWTR